VTYCYDVFGVLVVQFTHYCIVYAVLSVTGAFMFIVIAVVVVV